MSLAPGTRLGPFVECRMMAVDFAAGPPLRLGRPRTLFTLRHVETRFYCGTSRCYDVSPDGQRFYAVQHPIPPPAPEVTHINLILNWIEELKAKVPVK